MKRYLFCTLLLVCLIPHGAHAQAGGIYANPLKSDAQDKYVNLIGKIDVSKNLDFQKFNITIEISTDGPLNAADVPPTLPVLTTGITPSFNAKPPFYLPHKGLTATDPIGVNDDGTYYWHITTDPGVSYYYRQVIVAPNGNTNVATSKFDGDKGIVVPGSKTETDDFEKRSYRLLAPWPGLAVLLDPSLCQEMLRDNKPVPSTCTSDDPSGFGNFLNYIFRLLIGLSAVALVIRLIIEGYRYATTDVPFLKTSAKSGIGQAALGLIIALSAYLILNTINPKLVTNSISLQTVNVTLADIEGDSDSYQTGVTYTGGTTGLAGYDVKKAVFPSGIVCPGRTGGTGDLATVAKSFIGKVTYNQLASDKKNTAGYPSRGNPGPNGTFILDCSSFVTTVLQCAGITPGYKYAQTSLIFSGKEKITSGVEVKNGEGYVNGKKLKVGDLIGWTAQDGTGSGHVVIYIGNGLIMEAIGGRGRSPGKSVTAAHSLTQWQNQYRWVYRI